MLDTIWRILHVHHCSVIWCHIGLYELMFYCLSIMVLWIFCQFVGYQRWPGDQPCQKRGSVMAVPSDDPTPEYSPPSLFTTPHIPPPSAHIWVSVDSSCPHFHPNFSCNDNTPNNSPNPSTLHCSITVFRRMGLGAEMVGGRGGGSGRMVEWVELKGEGGREKGEEGEEKDKGEERLLFTAMKGCRWRDRHSSSG